MSVDYHMYVWYGVKNIPDNLPEPARDALDYDGYIVNGETIESVFIGDDFEVGMGVVLYDPNMGMYSSKDMYKIVDLTAMVEEVAEHTAGFWAGLGVKPSLYAVLCLI